jgi:hypothetical protein
VARVKIQLADNIKRVVVIDSSATEGAEIGLNLKYNGAVLSLAQLQALLGGSTTVVSNGGSSGPALNSILTTKGDLVTRDTTVQRLGIGATGHILRVAAGLPAWASAAALTKVDDSNVTLTLGGTPASSLLAAVTLTLGWTGELAADRGGTGLGSYAVGDILYADTVSTLATRSAGADGEVLTLTAGVPDWAPASTLAALRPATFIGSAALSTPINEVYILVPYACTIGRVTVLTQDGPGNCVLDIRKTDYGTFPAGGSIVAASPPTISAGIKYQDATLTGWSTALVAGDILAVGITSTSTFTMIQINIEVTPT